MSLILQDFIRVRRRLNRIATQHLKPLGIGTQQAAILRHITQHPGCSLAELARGTFSDPAAIGRSIDSLISMGWIEKSEHPTDRRQWVVDLTSQGNKQVRALELLWKKLSDDFVSDLSAAEEAKLSEILKKIDRTLEKQMQR